MRVCVEMSCYVEIDDPILKELDTIHKNGGYGTHEQYLEASIAVEKATNCKFLKADRDGLEPSEFRITAVYNAKDFEAIVEA